MKKRGDSDWRMSSKGLVYLQWKDTKLVRFISNFHDPEDTVTVPRKQKDGTSTDIPCLALVKDYNMHMNFVDRCDQYVGSYKVDRKSQKWWPRLFWHFVDLALVNAFIVYKARSLDARGLNLKNFCFAVATGLIGAGPSMPTRGRPSPEVPPNRFKVIVPPERRYDKVAHMPIHGTKVRCALCSTRLQPHRTRWHCSTCKVGLCLTEKTNCFQAFHKK